MRDRFQGALLGLSLTPTALSSWPQPAPGDRAMLTQAIDIALSSSGGFARLDATTAFYPDMANRLSPTFWLPASVPVLLRYHDSWARRLRRLSPLSALNALAVPACQRLAQIALLGDLLEAMDKGWAGSSWNDWLVTCSARYTDWPQLQIQYRFILSALALPESSSLGRWAQASASLPIDCTVNKNHDGFVQGVASALIFLESYVLAVNSAAKSASRPSAEQTVEATWESVFVSGLLAGALNGKSAIPVLWQMQPNLVETIAIANDLFSLWGGISTACDLPD